MRRSADRCIYLQGVLSIVTSADREIDEKNDMIVKLGVVRAGRAASNSNLN